MNRPARLRASILQLLLDRGPMTTTQLATALDIHRTAVDRSIQAARAAEPGCIHIHGWQRQLGTGGCQGALWAAGVGVDVQRPPPLTRKEQNAEYRRTHRDELILKQRERRKTLPTSAPIRPRVKAEAPKPIVRPPLSAMGHIVFAAVRPQIRTHTALLQALRYGINHAAKPAAQQQGV